MKATTKSRKMQPKDIAQSMSHPFRKSAAAKLNFLKEEDYMKMYNLFVETDSQLISRLSGTGSPKYRNHYISTDYGYLQE